MRPVVVRFAPQFRSINFGNQGPKKDDQRTVRIIDIAQHVTVRYRGDVFRIFALVLLVSALVVPRAAWGAHLSGHEDLSSAGAVHSHHDNHAHEHSAGDAERDEQNDAPGDLMHDHKPAFAIGGDIPLPEISPVDTVLAARSVEGLNELHLAVLSRPDSLLRPPRVI